MTNVYQLLRTVGTTFFLLAAGLGAPLASQAQYTPGNLVVLRVGDGSVQLSSNSAAVTTYLVEYTPSGILRSTIELNSTGTDNKLTNSGNSQGEGMITLSANGQYLLATGYNAAAGTAAVASTPSSTTARMVARIDGNRTVDISTALTNTYSGGTIRSVASLEGTNFFLSGSATGVRYATVGATTSSSISTTIGSTRVAHIYQNKVYFSTSSGTSPGIYVVDAATNTASGQTATSFLPTGSGTNSASPYGFVLLDRDPSVPGFDAAYVADDGVGVSAPSNPGIQKWSFNGTVWTRQGTIGSAYRGLTGTINSDGTVTLYATTNTSAGGNAIVTVTDTNPYNAPPSTTATITVVTAASNSAFRGVEFTPGTAVVLPVVLTGFAATRMAAGVQLRWSTASEANSARFEVERSSDGISFGPIATVAAAGTSQQPRAYRYFDAAPPAGGFYYRLRQVDFDGTSAYSPVAAAAASLPADLLAPNPAHDYLHLTAALPTAYMVRSVLGQALLSGTLASGPAALPVASLPAGVYFLELGTAEGRSVRRFVKE